MYAANSAKSRRQSTISMALSDRPSSGVVLELRVPNRRHKNLRPGRDYCDRVIADSGTAKTVDMD